MAEINDIAKLINQARRGDVTAEKVLYHLCYEHCFKIARLYTTDRTEAMSLFNHSMLDVFDQLKRFNDQESLIKWVSTVIKRDCIDALRKRTVYQNKLSVLKEMRTANTDPLVNDAISRLTMDEIFSVLHQLEDNQRLCLTLHAIEGYTYQEMADQLNININTAKWYVSKARTTLKEILMHYYPNQFKMI